MRGAITFAISVVAALLTSSALAWDHAGHMLVGQIAWEKTEPAVRERINEVVQLLPAQHNQNQKYNFITAPCWMDDMRSEPGYAWSKWHYVNMPWTPDGKAFEIPEPPHVIWALEEMRTKLRNADQLSKDEQAEAIGMLMHFTGDIHQPMHATERNSDRGGNGFLIMGVPLATLSPKRPANLHFFWDAAFRVGEQDGKALEFWRQPEIRDRPKAPGEGVIAAEAAKIMAKYPAENLDELKRPLTAEQFARESHEIGCKYGYPEGTEPSDTEVHPLSVDFIARSQEIACRRVAVAGYRLAALLNEVFANSKP